MTFPSREIGRAITPLRLIFWGGLICVFDFKINNFDLFHDLVGVIMIAFGVFSLAQLRVHENYAKAMLIIRIVVAISCLVTLMEQFRIRYSEFVGFTLSMFGIVELLAIVLFCLAMYWLCGAADLKSSTRSWGTTTNLFAIIYLIPLGLFYFAASIAIATGKSFNINLGPAGLLLIPVFFIPLIHLFISTSRMKTEAELLS